MARTRPVVLTVAGFDPSSGAGVTADLKTIAAHHCFGVASITALTVQSTKGVRKVQGVAANVVLETLEELASDFTIAAVHIGMLGTAAVAEAISGFLSHRKLSNIVLDPVLRSSSGTALLDGDGIKVLEKLLSQASVITPNLDEASVLTGLPVTNMPEMKAAAQRLRDLGAAAVVITGGHLDPPVDLLNYSRDGNLVEEEFEGKRQISRSTHGTGCAFATALACWLARGTQLAPSVERAKAYVEAAIANAYPVGEGIGPMNHLYDLDAHE